jgi:hypothetical protein
MTLGTRELTAMHRRQQLALRKTTIEQMERIWRALDWANLDRTYPGFAGEVAALVTKNRRTSTGLAAAYLRAFRIASGLSGDVRIIVPPLAPEQFTTSLRVSSLVAAKKSAARLVPAETAMSNALTLVSGEMVRLVLNGSRDTIRGTLAGDSQARGYRRIVGSGACDFCTEIGGSGSRIYKVDASFDAHARCGCTAEPAY